MKTKYDYIILIALTLFIVLLANTSAYATCVIVNRTQECAAGPMPTLTSIKFDKLLYENLDKPVITITGLPHSQAYLEIYDPYENIVFSHNIELLPTGVANYTLDISSYKLGVYSAIASTSANKVTTSFTVGLMPSGPVIALNVVKDTYIPGDSITILGADGPDGIIQLSLIDPNGIVVKSIPISSDKTGQFLSSDLKIPTNAISGIWQINATHGVSHTTLEIKVNSSTSIDVIRNNTNTTITVESPLKQFKSGVSMINITCKEGLVLMINKQNGSPACVTPQTSEKLIERGWGSDADIPTSLPYQKQNNGTLSGDVVLAGGPSNLVGSKANYEIDVYATDGVTIVGKILSDANGHYSIQLPAGNYTIYVPDYPTKQTHLVSVFSDKNTILNIVYGSGYK